MRTLLFSTLLLLTAVSARTEEDAIPWAKLRELAVQYNERCADKPALEKHIKKLNGVVEQRMIENDTMSEDNILRSVMLDWAASNSKKIVKKDPGCIAQACYFFTIFVDKGYVMPGPIRAELTPKVLNEIMEFLEKKIAEAK